MIVISEDAKLKIQEILEKNPGKYLRITIEGDGCAGPYLGLSLDKPEEYEGVTRVNGIDIVLTDTAQRISEVSTVNIFVNHIGKDLV